MDQNSNMGGFSPMPGQTPAFDTNAMPGMGQPQPAAAPMMGTPMTQNSTPAPAAAPSAFGMQTPTAAKPKNNVLMETLILVVVCIIAAAAIVMAVIFLMQYNDLKTNYDSDKNAAVAEAVAEQQRVDNDKFAEDQKKPFEKFTGPSDYGSIYFEYPKTWSVYVASDGTNNTDFVSYFHPGQVDPVNDTASRYALRFSVLNRQINTVQQQYDAYVTNGQLTSSAFSAGGNLSGTRYEGKISEGINGVIILIKINDKTAVFQTDAKIYEDDFNTLISKLRRNS